MLQGSGACALLGVLIEGSLLLRGGIAALAAASRTASRCLVDSRVHDLTDEWQVILTRQCPRLERVHAMDYHQVVLG